MAFSLFDTQDIIISEQRPKDMQCSNCGIQSHMIVRRIVHTVVLLYFPIFPYGRTDEVECLHCKSQFTYQEMGEIEKKEYEIFRPKVGFPWWSFLVSILITLGFVWGSFSGFRYKQKLSAKMETIEINRIVEFETADGEFSTFRICANEKDSLRMVFNKFQVEEKSEIGRILEKHYYLTDTISMSKAEVKNQVREGTIFEVHW